MSSFIKNAIVGFVCAYVCTMCIGAVVFQLYFGGEHIVIAISAAIISSWLTYKKFKEVHTNGQS